MKKTMKPEPPVYWYAVMKDTEDIDWGYGSGDFEEAKRMAAKLRPDNPGAHIVVVDITGDPVAVDQVWDIN